MSFSCPYASGSGYFDVTEMALNVSFTAHHNLFEKWSVSDRNCETSTWEVMATSNLVVIPIGVALFASGDNVFLFSKLITDYNRSQRTAEKSRTSYDRQETPFPKYWETRFEVLRLFCLP